ncbi:hypothetical protein HRbin16_01900 [bacterium HR16]|nr:hypothetical protein HRbin16_01900 [bacterium HR16]
MQEEQISRWSKTIYTRLAEVLPSAPNEAVLGAHGAVLGAHRAVIGAHRAVVGAHGRAPQHIRP